MRNYALLVRKDFISSITAYSNLLVIMIIWIAFLAFSPSAGPMMFIMLIYLMVISLFSTEENELVCNVAGILPIRRGQAVTARYLYTYAVLLTGFVLGVLVSVVGALLRLEGGGVGWLESLILSMSMALLMVDISIPLIYRFGMVKMRMLIMIIYILMIGAASAIMPLLGHWLSASSMVIALLALGATVVLSVISLRVSQRVVQR